MYAYAVSQLLMGIYSDRYGGVRILLIGGGLFTLGSLTFPLCSNFWLMYALRVLTGFGAGTVFLGIAKLINDLFPEKFSLVLGVALLGGYLGPVTGTVPMACLISAVGWRSAYLMPAVLCLCAMAVILLVMRGTIKKTVTGQTFSPFFRMLKNRSMWLLCFSSASVFGCYYVLVTQVGQKALEDFCMLNKYWASAVIAVLTIIVALNNLTVNLLLKLAKGRSKAIFLGGIGLLLVGTLLGYCSFRFRWQTWSLLASFLLIAFPAGFFSFYSTIAKRLNPPESTGLAVAVLNFSAFVFIALFGNISGWILNAWKGEMTGGVIPGNAYAALFLFLSCSALIAAGIACFVPETQEKRLS